MLISIVPPISGNSATSISARCAVIIWGREPQTALANEMSVIAIDGDKDRTLCSIRPAILISRPVASFSAAAISSR